VPPSSSRTLEAEQAVPRRALIADGPCAGHERARCAPIYRYADRIRHAKQANAVLDPKRQPQLRPSWQDRLRTVAHDPVRLRLRDQLPRAKLVATNTLQRSPLAS